MVEGKGVGQRKLAMSEKEIHRKFMWRGSSGGVKLHAS
jgi:hypothetical protein